MANRKKVAKFRPRKILHSHPSPLYPLSKNYFLPKNIPDYHEGLPNQRNQKHLLAR